MLFKEVLNKAAILLFNDECIYFKISYYLIVKGVIPALVDIALLLVVVLRSIWYIYQDKITVNF